LGAFGRMGCCRNQQDRRIAELLQFRPCPRISVLEKAGAPNRNQLWIGGGGGFWSKCSASGIEIQFGLDRSHTERIGAGNSLDVGVKARKSRRRLPFSTAGEAAENLPRHHARQRIARMSIASACHCDTGRTLGATSGHDRRYRPGTVGAGRRKDGSPTRRWRKADSNHRFRSHQRTEKNAQAGNRRAQPRAVQLRSRADD